MTTFDQCWEVLLDPAPRNQQQAHQVLASLCDSPDSIPILLDYLQPTVDPRVRALAAYALRTSLRNAVTISDVPIENYFDFLLSIIRAETDFALLIHLFVPAQELFLTSGSRWDLIADFVADCSNPGKVVLFLEFLARPMSADVMADHTLDIARVIDCALDLPATVHVTRSVFLLDAIVASRLGREARDAYISALSGKFTSYLHHIFFDGGDELLTAVVNTLLISFETDYIRFHFSELLQPLIESITNPRNSAVKRLACAAILGGLLEYDSLPLSEESIFSMISIAMDLVPFTCEDYGQDDSVATIATQVNGLLSGCFSRLSVKDIGLKVSSLFDALVETNPVGAFMVLSHGLSVSRSAFEGHRAAIAHAAILACSSPIAFLREWAAVFLCQFSSFFAPLFNPR
jgi:hypothetical protein